jgi:tetratricopeptide (TPR) repeat protein
MNLYFNSRQTVFSGLLTALICAFSLPALADDTEIKQGLEDAMKTYAERSATNLQPIEKALTILHNIEGKAEDPDLNYDIYILESRCYYWKGVHQTSSEDKLSTHSLGIEVAEKAKRIDAGFAEAYYFAGVNLARWGKAKGVVASLFRKGELENNMKETISHPTRNDQPGQTLDGYGADRVLGKMYYELPSVFGGSHEKSITHLKKAFTKAKDIVLNGVYFAESLNAGTKAEKVEARKVLEELIRMNPKDYNPNKIPETIDELEEARKLLRDLR